MPGRWDNVAEIKPGSQLTIYLKDGTKQKRRYESLDDEFLNCSNNYGSIPIVLTAIEKVDLHKRGKYMAWGILGGLLGGAAIGGRMASKESGEGAILLLPVAAGTGAAAGLLFGVLAGNAETIYISKEAALAKAAKK